MDKYKKSLKTMKRLGFVLLLLCVTVSSFGQRIYKDVSYRSNILDPYAVGRCKADIYCPAGATDCPVVVWFHGGGLTGGNKSIPARLEDSGLIVVAVNYRLMPKVQIATCIDDAAAAVAWTFRNIEKYGGNPEKIFVAGHSAGGYLTAMIGLDKHYLAEYNIDADKIKALVPFSGQAITHFAHRKQQGIEALQPVIDQYAPLYHVRPDAPPIVIVSGDRELEMNGRYEENAYFWRMLKLCGHPDVSLYELDGYDHGSMAEPAFYILKKTIQRLIPSWKGNKK